MHSAEQHSREINNSSPQSKVNHDVIFSDSIQTVICSSICE